MSIYHTSLKCEYLLRACKLKEATKYTSELMNRSDTCNIPLIICWRGRVLIYSGNEAQGKKLIAEALRLDPDLEDAKRALKMLKAAA